MVILPLAALKQCSKKKETRIEKEIVQVLQKATDRRKKTGNQKTRMMKFLALTLYFFARITLTLISACVIIGCF